MTNIKILEAFGGIDDDLISAADTKIKKSGTAKRAAWAAAAAAACAALVCAAAFLPALLRAAPSLPTDTSAPGSYSGSADGFGDPHYHGDEIGMYEDYKYAVDDGAFASYVQGSVILSSKIGSKIADVTVTAGWVRFGVWENTEHVRAEIYAIDGIPTETAVAIRFLDKPEAQLTEFIYVLINPQADTSAVKDYVIHVDPSALQDGEGDGILPE